MSFIPKNRSELKIQESAIAGLFIIELAVYGDQRGWFKENYQQAKLETLGLPHFNSRQNNISFNAEKGVTRGLHAEPWEKYISLASGRAYCAWVDLRPGSGFGRVVSIELDPSRAVFVPRGVANGYQTLEPNVAYTYLVNDHWSESVKYIAVNLFDPELKINWPISQDKAILSDKDRSNPLLSAIKPMEF